ncbi:bacterial sugar transferase [Lucifera butyrica]|uniref:Bacterial sugar transferase n=1 Tax=Lucifera butyrica TaxID=1351585 RepID=A0A498R883_9FIRM|nr:sugar transferase [Lucifera butyrica]VBB05348.1 bacterial sugar transferase [Lucifera butyrica]
MPDKRSACWRLLIIACDIFLLVMATCLAGQFTNIRLFSQFNLIHQYDELIFIIGAAGSCLIVNGLCASNKKMNISQIIISVIVTVFEFLALLLIRWKLFLGLIFSPYFYVDSALIQFSFLFTWHYIIYEFEIKKSQRLRILVIGSEEFFEYARFQLMNSFKTCEITYRETKSLDAGFPVEIYLQSFDSVFISDGMPSETKKAIVLAADLASRQVIMVPGIYDVYCSSMEFETLYDWPIFRIGFQAPSLEIRFLKRTFDLVVSSLGIILLLPVYILVGVLVKITSHGQVVYTQVRCGQNERLFKIYKFRTMYDSAEAITGPVFCSENDPRVTPLGRFLRATRIDELPQLYNVLKGDMSLVGPRPERPEFVAGFKQEFGHYSLRHKVKPGLTGLAQVRGKYNTSISNKILYDLMYIQKWSFLTDLVLLFETLKVLLSKESTEGVSQSSLIGKPEKESQSANYIT